MAIDLKSIGKKPSALKNKDRVKIKVVNIQNPGQDIVVGDNGTNYVIQDQAVVEVPISVYNGLKECVYTEYRVEGNMDTGRSIKEKSVARFFVTRLDDFQEEEESIVDDLKKNEDID